MSPLSEMSEALVVVVSGHRCAVPMERVAAVRLYTPETPMPGLPKCVRGVVERNGAPVHVVDAAQRLGHDRSTPDERACVLFFEDIARCGSAALLVDEVEHIVARNVVDAAPAFVPRELLAATIAGDPESLPLLDLDRFFDLHPLERP